MKDLLEAHSLQMNRPVEGMGRTSSENRVSQPCVLEEEDSISVSMRSKSQAATERDFEMLSQHGITEDTFEKIQQKHQKSEEAKQRNQALIEREEHMRHI